MKSSSRIVLCLLALFVVAGCASTNVTQQTPMSSPGLARPNRIWVYNFVANSADMPTLRDRIRCRDFGDGHGSRRLRGHAARMAQTRVRDADLFRKQNPRNGRSRCGSDCHCESDRPYRRRRGENLWRNQRQERTPGQGQGDRRRNFGSAQNQIPGSWLDPVSGKDRSNLE
jgi:hypothetical protein